MKKIITLFIVFFLINTTHAQVSGFMGKKFSVIYNLGVGAPHIYSSINPITKKNEVKLLPTINHAINLEYIVSNNTAVGFRYKLGTNAQDNSIDYNNYIDFVEKIKFYSHTFGAYSKFYKKNALAPIGTYTIVGIGLQQLVLKDVIRPNYLTNKITMQDYSQYDLLIHFGSGRNWIIGNRILIGYQIDLGITHASVVRTLTSIGSSSDETKNGYSNGTRLASKMNFSNELLKISLNIGFLAF